MKPKKILIVDDDVITAATLTQILIQNGYQVFRAEDKDRGAKVARRSLPDMIICNAESEKVDVVQFVKLIRESPQTRSAAILLLTERREKLAGEPVLLGPRQYLLKPFTREQVAIVVQENLKQRQMRKR